MGEAKRCNSPMLPAAVREHVAEAKRRVYELLRHIETNPMRLLSSKGPSARISTEHKTIVQGPKKPHRTTGWQ